MTLRTLDFGHMPETSAINVKDVPDDVYDAVVGMARERGISIADEIGQSIAAHYGVAWESSGYPFTEPAGATQWVIRLPHRLKALVAEHARTSGNTQRGIVLMILARANGLDVQSARSRRALTEEQVRDARRRHEAGESIRSLARELHVKRQTLSRALRAAA